MFLDFASEFDFVVKRLVVEDYLSVALVAAVAMLVVSLGVFEPVQDVARDGLLRIAATWPPSIPTDMPDAAVVAIDSQSLRAYTDWPWPRRRHAELVQRLSAAGAEAIAFDVDFSVARDPEDDASFGQAIAASSRVVLGAVREYQELGIGVQVEIASFPAPVIASGAAKIGIALVPLDSDGTIRDGMRAGSVAGRELPSLAYATFVVASSQDEGLPSSELFSIDYRRANPPIPIVSVVDFLEDRFDPADIAGRAVFVGATAPILQDLWRTPLGPNMAGVLVQAIEYRQHVAERADRAVLTVAGAPSQLGVALLVLLAARLLSRGSHRRRVAISASMALALPPLALGVVVFTGVLLEPVLPLFVIVLHYVLGLERVRVQIARRLLERERSISALTRVGRIASERFGPGNAKLAIGLLGETTGTRALSLLRLGAEGEFESKPIEWVREGRPLYPSHETARQVLAAREIRLLRGGAGGAASSQSLYVPLVTGAQPVGVLVARVDAGELLSELQISTIESVGRLIGLAMVNDELIHNLRSAREQAEAASRAKTEFLANMSHEIRTPMTAALGYMELIGDPKTNSDERAELIDSANRNGQHLLDIINDILDLSQIEADRLRLTLKPVRLAELCREVESMLRQKAREKELRFEVEYSDELPEIIQTDPIRLKQILVNLLGNAIKFTESGFVHLSVSLVGASMPNKLELRFEVTDSGIGIDEATQEHMFEPFVQADTSSVRRYGGTGLGLAITKRLIDLLGGTIDVRSEPGRGSCFSFTLFGEEVREQPATRAAANSVVGTDQPQPATSEELIGRVLVAEDGLDNQKIIERFLSRAGLEVELAENGRSACDKAIAALEAGQPFDLIFMDIDMPVLDGYEATALIREAGYKGPVIALTAHALPTDRERCLEAGCDDYATKPIARESLLATAARYLEKQKVGP